MLFDNMRRKNHQKTIKHKIQTVFIITIILTFILSKFINIILNNIISPFNIIISLILFFTYIYYVSNFAAKLLSFKFIHQVNKMTNVAKAIANSKKLDKRVNQSSRNDELKVLEEALNSMLDQLENVFENQRKFISNASHELRTPLSILKGYIDILNEWGLQDEEILKESTKSIKEETHHMQKLIENLLFLARSDQGHMSLNIDEINLKSIIEKLILDMKLISGNRDIIYHTNENLIFHANSELILQLLRALVENSIKYTDDNGNIIINSYTQKKYVRIDVIDDGIGISEEDIKKIFERFYRGDKARYKNSSGNGLGLSLVKKIVEGVDYEFGFKRNQSVKNQIKRKRRNKAILEKYEGK